MITTDEFTAFIDSLPDPTVQIHNFGKATYHTINLKGLTKGIENFHDFREWWKSKNMPRHLNNTIALTIIGLNPPESIKNAMLFLML
ncbi:hypothetical protein EBT16_00600 [bacterium]|nr:hypothetical protein [bacterium]NCA17735.1 hypothetical protein [Betaproteobacteria bacterium]